MDLNKTSRESVKINLFKTLLHTDKQQQQHNLYSLSW